MHLRCYHESHIHRVVALMAWPFNDIISKTGTICEIMTKPFKMWLSQWQWDTWQLCRVQVRRRLKWLQWYPYHNQTTYAGRCLTWNSSMYDDVMTWRHVLHYLPIVVTGGSPHKGPVMKSFANVSLACTSFWINPRLATSIKYIISYLWMAFTSEVWIKTCNFPLKK